MCQWRPGFRRSPRRRRPASAQICSALQLPAATAERGATAATESRNATTTVSLLARTNSPAFPVSKPLTGSVDTTSPPSAGSVAIALHGMEMSSARGAPDTSGAVMSETWPSAFTPCGHRIVAVVCLTGNRGTRAHSSAPVMPATMASQPRKPVRRSRSVVMGHEARSYATWAGPTKMQPARRAEEGLDTSFAAFTMLAVEIRPQCNHTDFRKNPAR